MEHLYKYRKSYGVESGSTTATLVEHGQRQMLIADEAEFFKNLEQVAGDYPPGSVLWVCRHIRRLSIILVQHLWTSGTKFWDEIRGGSLNLPRVILKMRSWSPGRYLKKTVAQTVQEFDWIKERLRPLVYGMREAFKQVDIPTRAYGCLLLGATCYLLWRSHFYIRHIRWKEVDLKDKVVLITGGNSGIGERLVYEFLDRGAHVIIIGSDITKTLQVVENVTRYMATKVGTPEYEYDKLPNDGYCARPEDFLYPLPHLQPTVPDYVSKLHWLQLDLGNSQTIWRAVYHLFETFDHVDVIINNGAICLPDSLEIMSPDGYEAHFSVNYYGHFILTNLILSFMELPLQRSCKIINVICKEAFCEGTVTIEQIEKAFNNNSGIMDCPYARSKHFNLMFHQELTKRVEIAGLKDMIRTYAVSPPVCETNLKRHFPFASKWDGWIPGLSADAGAQTILHCALSQSCENQTGLYYERCHVSTPKLFGYRYLDKDFDKMCERLWDITEEASKLLIDFYKTEDKPLPKGDCYGCAVFRDIPSEIPELDPDEDNMEPPSNNGWMPQPVRKLIEFRNYYTPVFRRLVYFSWVIEGPLIESEWKDSMCNRGLIDLYTTINGPLRFAPRPNPTKIPNQDDFDPLYDRPPIQIATKNSWIY